MDREQAALVTLYDYATREGSTAKGVLRKMKDAGFSVAEIEAAAKRMNGTLTDD